MPYPLELLAHLVVLALSVAAIRRRRVVDAHGNAQLRYHGPALLCLGAGLALLHPAAHALGRDPHALLTEAVALPLGLAALAFACAVWFHRQKITLAPEEILHSRWPARTRWYPRGQLVGVEPSLFGLAVHLRDGRRVAFPPFASGRRYFEVQLELIAARAHGDASWCAADRRLEC